MGLNEGRGGICFRSRFLRLFGGVGKKDKLTRKMSGRGHSSPLKCKGKSPNLLHLYF